MPRLMYDSVNPRAIPRDATLVAGYIDGSVSRWPAEAWGWFPRAKMVRISAVGSTWDADVFDVEAGAIWPPARVVPLVIEARRHGRNPTVYVNEVNDWAPTREAFRRAGVPEPHWWVANYNGVRAIPPGSVGRQYAHPGQSYLDGRPSTVPWETGRHWDESWMADYWPGIDDEPPAGGEANRELEMGTHLVRNPESGAIYLTTITTTTRSKWRVPDPATSAALAELMGVPGARDVSPAAAEWLSDEPGSPLVDVDEAAIVTGLIPSVVAAIQNLDFEGLTFEQQVEAVREAMRRGTA